MTKMNFSIAIHITKIALILPQTLSHYHIRVNIKNLKISLQNHNREHNISAKQNQTGLQKKYPKMRQFKEYEPTERHQKYVNNG